MKVTDIEDLYVGYSPVDKFRILICADSKEDAQALADEYCRDTGIHLMTILDFDHINMKFDCDYVIR